MIHLTSHGKRVSYFSLDLAGMRGEEPADSAIARSVNLGVSPDTIRYYETNRRFPTSLVTSVSR